MCVFFNLFSYDELSLSDEDFHLYNFSKQQQCPLHLKWRGIVGSKSIRCPFSVYQHYLQKGLIPQRKKSCLNFLKKNSLLSSQRLILQSALNLEKKIKNDNMPGFTGQLDLHKELGGEEAQTPGRLTKGVLYKI